MIDQTLSLTAGLLLLVIVVGLLAIIGLGIVKRTIPLGPKHKNTVTMQSQIIAVVDISVYLFAVNIILAYFII